MVGIGLIELLILFVMLLVVAGIVVFAAWTVIGRNRRSSSNSPDLERRVEALERELERRRSVE